MGQPVHQPVYRAHGVDPTGWAPSGTSDRLLPPGRCRRGRRSVDLRFPFGPLLKQLSLALVEVAVERMVVGKHGEFLHDVA